ncbi:biopolymer transporter ExbD [Bacteroides sp. 224]|uniref:ExbD/TolR family protein n=1 Tax=Bacteroides sp. 224 TaxID=2302936 RepID=UPI0013CF5FBF|nr:biopolymer transporter ExbD [Bacteroides sp. 224]NDV65620.1 biopolymer transporter ExbD [Bacteroides sp. 224]
MAKGNRKVPEINSSSTADIAFIILIFFLVTTSMDTDMGLARRLPPPPEDNMETESQVIKERNILKVYINANNQLMVGNDVMEVADLKQRAKDFIANPYNDEKLPEKRAKDVEFFGNVMVTANHVVSLQNDRMTSYQVYIAVQNELVAAYNELRNEKSQEKWQRNYDELEEAQQKAIRDIYPQKISEAEPKVYGGRN